MKVIRVILALFFLFVLSTLFIPHVRADIVSPEYINAKCGIDEEMVECPNGRGFYQVNSTALFLNNNECQKYANNPNFRKIAIEGHGFEKYCNKISTTFFQELLTNFKYFGLMILITILLELPIYLLFGFRSLNNIKNIIFINVITVVYLNLFLRFMPYSSILLIFFLEALVIISEALYLYKSFDGKSFLKILFISILANTISATIGTIILIFFFPGNGPKP